MTASSHSRSHFRRLYTRHAIVAAKRRWFQNGSLDEKVAHLDVRLAELMEHVAKNARAKKRKA